MRDFDNEIAHWRERRAIASDDLASLESGELRFGENRGDGWKDTTPAWIEHAKAEIASLDRLISAYEKLNAQRP